jgi:hypothetical protein
METTKAVEILRKVQDVVMTNDNVYAKNEIEKAIKIIENLFLIVETRDYTFAYSNEEIKIGDYWIYICPMTGVDYGDDGNPIVKNNLGKAWFNKLHDKANYKRVIAYYPKNNAPEIIGLPILNL